MKCKNCGHKNEKEALFCFNCGTRLEKKEKSKKSKLIIIVSLILTAVLLCSLLVVLLVSKDARAYDKHIKEGYNYFNNKQYDEAIIEFDSAIKIDPKRQEAYIGKVDVYVETEEYDKAGETVADAEKQGVMVPLDKFDEDIREVIRNVAYDSGQFKLGDVIEANGKIIYADGNGIYVRKKGEDEHKKISSANVYEILTDGKEIYYVQDNTIHCLDADTGEDTSLTVQLEEETRELTLRGKFGDYLYFRSWYGVAEEGSDYILNLSSRECKKANTNAYTRYDIQRFKDKIYYLDSPIEGAYSGLYVSNLDGSEEELLSKKYFKHKIIGNELYYVEAKGENVDIWNSEAEYTYKCRNLDTNEEKTIKENAEPAVMGFTDFAVVYTNYEGGNDRNTYIEFYDGRCLAYYSKSVLACTYNSVILKDSIIYNEAGTVDVGLIRVTSDGVEKIEIDENDIVSAYCDGYVYYKAENFEPEKVISISELQPWDSEELDYQHAYKVILERYKRFCFNKLPGKLYDFGYMNMSPVCSFYYIDAGSLYYFTKDISGDDVPELFVCMGRNSEEGSVPILEIFTFNGNGAIRVYVKNDDSGSCYLAENGLILCEFEGRGNGMFSVNRIKSNPIELEEIRCIKYDYSATQEFTEGENYESATNPISEEEAVQIINSYVYEQVQPISIAEYEKLK